MQIHFIHKVYQYVFYLYPVFTVKRVLVLSQINEILSFFLYSRIFHILSSNVTGCPDGKKVEFITSLLDALTTDMVNTINSPTPSGGGR